LPLSHISLMKKFLIICLLLFTASVGCKKMDIDGGGLCACSPITGPQMFLGVKNAAGDDLLNGKTTGAYTKETIQVFRKDGEGRVVPIYFDIRAPFAYGNDQTKTYLLQLPDLNFLKPSTMNTIYLKLGESALYELELDLAKYGEEKVFINKKEAERDKDGKNLPPIFYLTIAN
jgi:hypothetical protein